MRKASARLAPRLPNTSKEMCVGLEGAIGVSALTVWDERPRRRSAVPRHSLLPPRCSNEDVSFPRTHPCREEVKSAAARRKLRLKRSLGKPERRRTPAVAARPLERAAVRPQGGQAKRRKTKLYKRAAGT